ncbi:MHYT domain-containing protein [Plasmodiophora brassicae]|uniref:MHYT domain-containing protein n=1 Tax=Plasmodiophora brassicae TaxID=37360 RepID=A0A0G4IJ08_PLABS|nr:hypothetical protein PBRA_003954 [Plasmodiophora brassicae]
MSLDGTPIEPTWSWKMVALSYLISVAGATTAISLNDLRRRTTDPRRARALIAAVSFCFGGISIFMMHFVGMGGVVLVSPVTGDAMPITFDLQLTVLSMAVGMVSVWLGLTFVSKDPYWVEVVREKRVALMIEHTKRMTMKEAGEVWRVRLTVLLNRPERILAGGTCIAIGVCSMHYCGLYAMRVNATMTFIPGIVVLSFVIAVVAACAGSWLIFRVLTFQPTLFIRTLCAVVIGIAVCGMHYTGMYGVTFQYSSAVPVTGPVLAATFPQDISHIALILCFIFDAWVRNELLLQIEAHASDRYRSRDTPLTGDRRSGTPNNAPVKINQTVPINSPTDN